VQAVMHAPVSPVRLHSSHTFRSAAEAALAEMASSRRAVWHHDGRSATDRIGRKRPTPSRLGIRPAECMSQIAAFRTAGRNVRRSRLARRTSVPASDRRTRSFRACICWSKALTSVLGSPLKSAKAASSSSAATCRGFCFRRALKPVAPDVTTGDRDRTANNKFYCRWPGLKSGKVTPLLETNVTNAPPELPRAAEDYRQVC
jgi:hypothetical protein